MITRGLGTDALVTRGYGGGGLLTKIAEVLRIQSFIARVKSIRSKL